MMNRIAVVFHGMLWGAVVLLPAPAARAAFIDDFSSFRSEWVLTRTFEQNNSDLAVSYDVTTNPGTLTWSFEEANATGSNRVQTTLLRDDVTLGVGQYAQVQIWMNPTPSVTNAGQLLGGLLFDQVSKTPADEDGFVGLLLDPTGSGRLRVMFDGTEPVVATNIGSFSGIYLRLARLSVTEIQASYSLDGNTFVDVGPVVTISNVAAIGVFNGNASNQQFGTVQYDNFAIVPEPRSLLLIAIGLSLAVCGRRFWR